MSTETLPALHGVKVGDKLAKVYTDRHGQTVFSRMETVTKITDKRIYIGNARYKLDGLRVDSWATRDGYLRIPTEQDFAAYDEQQRMAKERGAEQARREAIRNSPECVAASVISGAFSIDYYSAEAVQALVRKIGLEKVQSWAAEIEAVKEKPL